MGERIPDLSLVIPCYNEAAHLESSVGRLLSACDLLGLPYEVILVDDASTDGTRQILKSLPARYASRRLRVYFNERNLGRGATVGRGLRLARAPIAGFLDIDLEVDAAYIGTFYRSVLHGADVAIGRRVYGVSLRSLPRFFMTRGYILLRRAALGLPFEDTEAGYKFFRLESAGPVLAQCRDPGWFWDTEIVARSYDAGLQIVEVTCLFVRRYDKASTVRPLRDSWRHLVSLLRFRRLRGAARRPAARRPVKVHR